MAVTHPFYITTPIYYVNGDPHMGHAYCTVACDVLARYKRLDGFTVKFLTGTDEHGQKVEQSARNAALSPQEFTDQVSDKFRQMGKLLNISNDDFIRTTEPRHKKSVQALWRKLKDAGYIYLGSYAGWYAVRDEAFYGEDELRDGPNGKKIAPTGAECEWVEEPSYFFRLSAFQDKLLELYDKHPEFIQPYGPRNEIISFVKSSLKDLSVSRTTFSWGVPVPDDEKHIMYVWIDALANYITALGYPETDPGTPFAQFWPNSLHVVGKEITRFHAIYWPAFLMAADLPVPKRIFAHGLWLMDGEKMSKSLGNVISPDDLVKTWGLDQLRYYFLREIPFGNDGNFTKESMIQRINHELANDYGNLVQRVLAMVQKNCDAQVPQAGTFTEADNSLLGAAHNLLTITRSEMDNLAFHKALDAIWNVIRMANRYIDEQAPWALKKTDPPRMNTVLYVLAETIRYLGILTQPFMPDSSGRILDLLAVPSDQRTFAFLGTNHALMAGTPLPAPQGVFPRYVEEAA